IYGDVNGDGKITVMDMVYQQRHILGVEKLTGVYLKAADACRSTGNGTVELLDMVYVKRHILEILTISQE
ncbi:MAG: dockerin type I repeat-containing protein, partial [Lachnospiraceae bacterium]|nr:dockerin type I repeat-containing protein [Lachnospiraceae bacterium]